MSGSYVNPKYVCSEYLQLLHRKSLYAPAVLEEASKYVRDETVSANFRKKALFLYIMYTLHGFIASQLQTV